MRSVIFVDSNLPVGLLADTAASLGVSLGSHVKDLIGSDIKDKDGFLHKGITKFPLTILTLTVNEMSSIYSLSKKEEYSDILFLGFSKIAQGCETYEEYQQKILTSKTNDIDLVGLCLYGPGEKINKIKEHNKLSKYAYLF